MEQILKLKIQMIKLFKIFILVIFFVFPISIFAGSVKDSNNGNSGDLLIHSGKVQGKSSDIGTWTDIKSVPELKGDKGNSGKKGDTGKGLKNQYIGSIGLRLWDYQRHTSTISYGRDFGNNNNIVEFRITIKLEKSYIDRKIEKLEEKLNRLENNILY